MSPKTISVVVGGPEPPPARSEKPLPALASSLLFTKADRAMRRQLETALKSYHLGIMQWLALGMIAAANGSGVGGRQLAENLGIVASQATGITQALLKAHLVRPKATRDDYRSKQFIITAKGRTVADDAEVAVQTALRKWLQPVPENYLIFYQRVTEIMARTS